ncbi:MAG: tRNA (N(6)-L-threonylcarbamoyladenosine(37)-C(2))-methylthiotransferase MtaB [Peptococcaceae bacterium]|nr:tRNA (N(6)-L-threonylcarbamoyladenosine(37)-C(2))-methylthiotransferase MtaB [Peptococcaceae bacterium]
MEHATRCQRHSRRKSAAFLSMGCKVNQTEIEGLTELFRQAGYAILDGQVLKGQTSGALSERPRVFIINTCAVTAVAEGKSRRLIRRVVRENPESIVAVMGCFSQLALEQVKALGAHIVIGTRERRSLLTDVEGALKEKISQGSEIMPFEEEEAVLFEELPRLSREKHVRATVKIQDGCNQRCSYCTVPAARGPSRSRQPERVLDEVKSLLEQGHKEIILTGIHLGCYGRDFDQSSADIISLADLIDQIAPLPGLVRLRLSSLESTEIGAELLEVLKVHRDVMCPHFHIPLQSGSDRVLARMERPYSCAGYLGALKEIRQIFPDAAITTDIMAGFPGEAEEDAEAALSMVEECGFADIHAFGFSARPGTAAAHMKGQVPAKVKEARVRALIECGRKVRAAYLQRFYGQVVEVLIEGVDEKGARGYTRNYICVDIPAQLCREGWQSGDLVEVLLAPSMVGAGGE